MTAILSQDEKAAMGQDPEVFFGLLDQQMGLSSPDLLTLDFGGDPQREQLVQQQLADLGYRPGNGLEGLVFALNEFKAELGLKSGEDTDAQALERLEQLTVFEGEADDLDFPAPLAMTGRGVLVRLLQYRLAKLGFYHYPVDGTYREHTLIAVIAAKDVLGWEVVPHHADLVDRGLLQTLGNPFELNRLLLARRARQPLAVRCALAPEGVAAADWPGIRVTATGLETRRPELGEPLAAPEELLDDPANRFGVCLLQLWLRMLSLYQGRLDGIFGPDSIKALMALARENLLDEERCLVWSRSGHLVIAAEVFTVLGRERPSEDEVQVYEAAIAQEYATHLAKVETVPEDEIAWPSQKILEKAWDKAKSFFRSLYQGAKSVVVLAGKALAKGAMTVWTSTLGKLVRPGLHLMSYAWARIKKGLARFWLHLKKLYRFLASRVLTGRVGNAVAVSGFERDFDCLNVISAVSLDEQRDLLDRHLADLRERARDFGLACDVVGAAIGLVFELLAGPVVGWPRLALRAAEAVLAILEKAKGRQGLLPEEGSA